VSAGAIDHRARFDETGATAPAFAVAARADGGRVALTVTGELDMATSHLLTDLAAAATDSPRCRVVELDLRGVTFLDSSGLRALVRLRLNASTSGRAFRITGRSRPVDRLLDQARLEAELEDESNRAPA
jgi:anti-sigma B factor antagonist